MTGFRFATITALALSAGFAAAAAAPVHRPAVRPPVASTDMARIVAVVNGHPITNQDVDARARLFAIASGLPVSPDTLDRLKPQMTRQLIDERLRMDKIEDDHIVVPDKEIAAAIRELEGRNGMQPGGLRRQLDADGVSFITLVDQLRTQLGWTQVLRQSLGERATVTDAEVAAQQRLLAQQVGKPEYHVGEIYIPTEGKTADTNAFAQTVIKELRSGAPFPVVAAQFSQSQSALQGGDLGWVQPNQLDPQVARVVSEMPPGAVSDPIDVPGGVEIVTLVGKREIGNEISTVLSLREVFLPFATNLNPQAPTPQQIAQLQKARAISTDTKSCDQMEQVAKEENSPRPANPGDVRLDQVNPPSFREMLSTQPIGVATKPLVSPDEIAVMIVCSRDEKNMAQLSAKEIKQQLFVQRVDLLSRQLVQDLRSQARIEMRPATGNA